MNSKKSTHGARGIRWKGLYRIPPYNVKTVIKKVTQLKDTYPGEKIWESILDQLIVGKIMSQLQMLTINRAYRRLNRRIRK